MPEYDFTETVALVTGGARGQGKSHALEYARHGADVAVLDVCENKESCPFDLGTREELDAVVEEVESMGQRGLALQADVSVESDVASAVDVTLDEFGQIDVLANNAGLGTVSDLLSMDEVTWDEMLDTNLKGVWLCSKHVGQHFAERSEGGKIVNTSSGLGLIGAPGQGHYSAAKHGVLGLTKTLALELAEHDVNVNAVCPAAVDTPMVEGSMEQFGDQVFEQMAALAGPMNIFDPVDPAVPPQDISEAFMWLSSEASRYVTGIALPVDAGHTAK